MMCYPAHRQSVTIVVLMVLPIAFALTSTPSISGAEKTESGEACAWLVPAQKNDAPKTITDMRMRYLVWDPQRTYLAWHRHPKLHSGQTSFWPNFILVCADEVIESKFAHELAAVAHGRYWHTPTVLIWRKFFRPQSEWSRSRPVAAQCVDFVGVQRRGPGIKENLAGGCCQRRGWRTTQTRLKRTSPSLGIRRERILQSRLLSWCRHLKTTRTQLPTCFPISISWSCGARSVRLLRGRMAQTCRQSSYQ